MKSFSCSTFSCYCLLGASAWLHLGFDPAPWGPNADVQQERKQRSPHQQSLAVLGLFNMLLCVHTYMRCTISRLVLFGARALSFQFSNMAQHRAVGYARGQPGWDISSFLVINGRLHMTFLWAWGSCWAHRTTPGVSADHPAQLCPWLTRAWGHVGTGDYSSPYSHSMEQICLTDDMEQGGCHKSVEKWPLLVLLAFRDSQEPVSHGSLCWAMENLAL